MRLADRFRKGVELERATNLGSVTYKGDVYFPNSGVSFNGINYGANELVQSMHGQRTEIAGDFSGYLRAAQSCPPVFGAQNKRARYLSQARFAFRNKGTRKTFGTSALSLLEQPWTNGTTGELISKMEWHAGLAGNAYAARIVVRGRETIKLMNPGWVSIVLGSDTDQETASVQLDAEVIGYVYHPGGFGSGNKPLTLLPEQVAHWSPLPDPDAAFRGMSWVTPAIREIQGDNLASEHKIKFFENGATPNLVVTGIPAATREQFDEIVEGLELSHSGVQNAYRTLYLTAGADATVVGSDLKQIDFKATQGAGETRIAMLSEVPASLLGISEGMQGSSLNAGNYAESRRSFIDGWLTSSLQSLAACLGQIVDVPSDAELWFDTSDMPIVREDARDAAEIEGVKATTIRTYVDGGFDPASVVEAVNGQDVTKLKHTGKLSVQLQEPGATNSPEVPDDDDS